MKTSSLDFDTQALREKILDLAMRGKLVKQDPNDEPAKVLLEKIKAEKAELVKEKKIKKSKPLPEITDDEKPFDIPDSWEWVRLDEINTYNGKSVHPDKEPTKNFELYSVPIYETRQPEITVGKEIRSNKQTVGPEDVLLCKINPRINRVWKVGNFTQYETIASTEWIVVRQKKIISEYLRYALMSPYFRKLLQSNVSGVGGSLTRAKPVLVRKYPFPLPPLEEQSRIAAKIAQLFALLRKVESSTQQYAKLQTLLKSKVLDLAMRGKLVKQDPNDEPASVLLEKEGLKESNEIPHQIPNSWSWIVLGSGAKFINGRAYKKSELLNDSSLTPILRVGNLFTNSSYYYSDLKLNPDKYIDNGDLIYAWSASFGPKIWTGDHVIYHYHIWKVIPKQIIEKQFLYYFLLDKRNVIGETDLHGSTMKHITKTNMEHLSFPLPPLSEQKRIVKKINFLLKIL